MALTTSRAAGQPVARCSLKRGPAAPPGKDPASNLTRHLKKRSNRRRPKRNRHWQIALWFREVTPAAGIAIIAIPVAITVTIVIPVITGAVAVVTTGGAHAPGTSRGARPVALMRDPASPGPQFGVRPINTSRCSDGGYDESMGYVGVCAAGAQRLR